MIQSLMDLRSTVVLLMFACAGVVLSQEGLAERGANEEGALPLTSALASVPGETKFEDHRTTIEWKGQDYGCAEGARVLIDIVAGRHRSSDLRAEALRTLRRIPSIHLRDPETVNQLISTYDSLEDSQEKVDLVAIVGAWSPRALPFLARILGSEKDTNVRQLAAAGLGGWNIRSGVAELIGILEECNDDASRDRIVCNEASKEFSWLNARKGWGFPERRIREEIVSRTDLTNEEMSALFVSEIKKWWAANEHRFPEWKLGDAPPEDGEGHKNDSSKP